MDARVSPGMTQNMPSARSSFPIQLSNSICRRRASSPVLFVEAPGRPVFPLPSEQGVRGSRPPLKARGRRADRRNLSFSARTVSGAWRLSARHRGFSVPGAVASGRGAGGADNRLPLSGRLPPSFVPTHVQPSKAAGRLVPADGWPGPPGIALARHNRGRRILLHHRDASR